MARNSKVMKLWTAIVTAFLALCTALGFVSATTAAAVPQTETPRNSTGDDVSTDRVTIPAQTHWLWSQARSLPPTMKQRIRAEAHGKTPSCRTRPLDTTESETTAEPPAAPLDC
ncbi:DUF6344 domain-containing protein [Streptomyces sp. NPDC008092]|uniref:DUF6344 domain-containing protein n=1 Tax=Streptomyces sp. NPDC008092 TaxID=3364808 RepID=UPI0036E80964